METVEVWKKIDLLKRQPELANTPGYEMAELLESADAVDCFFLIREQPQFSPPNSWWFELRHRSDLPWADLLSSQPQFAEKAHWESVSRLELMKLTHKAPAILERRFPKCRPQELYSCLTPLEKQILLSDLPQLEDQVDWGELDREWNVGNWMMLLACQPQFESHFDWKRVEKKTSPYWSDLLRKQPQFARHCDPNLLEDWQIRRIRRKQPQLVEEWERSRA